MEAATAVRPDVQQVARRWLAAFDKALRAQNAAAAAALFLPDSHWRDVLAFTWHLQTVSGAPAIEKGFRDTLAETRPRALRYPEGRTAPRRVRRAGRDIIEAIIEFETAYGMANAVVRLSTEGEPAGAARAWTLSTSLETLRGFDDEAMWDRRNSERYSRDFGGANWLDQRNKVLAYEDRDPAVLVVGGGQAGLAIAARLGNLGIDTLIVDRNERIGDNWRRRYHSLTLHNEVHVNHLPYMPFPPTWPVFIPKDKLANWFESYVESLELNFWTGTELVSGSYLEGEGCWQVTLRRSDGSERVLRPRHLVFATGVSSIPQRPSLPGLDSFAGDVLHSGDYTAAAHGRGARRWCSAPATAATTSPRTCRRAASTSRWSSAARPISSASRRRRRSMRSIRKACRSGIATCSRPRCPMR